MVRSFHSFFVEPPIATDVIDDKNDSYFKFNLDTINLFSLIRWEDNRTRRGLYRQAYDLLRKTTDHHGNAHFNMIDRALNGADAGARCRDGAAAGGMAPASPPRFSR